MSAAPHVVCPHCFVTNRVSAAKPPLAAQCGRCKQRLFEGEPVTVDTAHFQRLIDHTDIPVVVDFWPSWCGPCKMMAPIFAEAARVLEPRARLAKVNTEQEEVLAARSRYAASPVCSFSRAAGKSPVKPGRWIKRHCCVGCKPTSLRAWLEFISKSIF